MRYYVVVVLLIAHILIESGCGTDTMDYKADGGFWVWRWLTNWTGTSPTMLRAVEKKILSFMKTPYKAFFVDIGPAIGASDKIWTISLNEESKEVPLVMLHGFGAGVALWVMNLESLSKDRPVYAMDVLGFGRSSRPKFSTDPLIAEKQFVKSVEEWRNEMKLNKMILLGHSMGGYIATSYALSYPDRVKHLILADPWGFPEKNTESTSKKMPLWVRAVGYMVTSLNPLWILRASGPFGQWLVQKTRPDIMRKFSSTLEGDLNLLPQYIHQCNAQTPSGETAFHTMMEAFGWARNPMIRRCKDVREDIPITFIYGSRSWIESSSGEKIKGQRVNSVVDIKFVNGAGHHVYADKPEVFNRYVNETCDIYRLRDGIAGMGQRGAGYIREATESDEENDIRIPIATTREKSPEAEQSPPQTQPSAPTAPQEPTPTPAASKN